MIIFVSDVLSRLFCEGMGYFFKHGWGEICNFPNIIVAITRARNGWYIDILAGYHWGGVENVIENEMHQELEYK